MISGLSLARCTAQRKRSRTGSRLKFTTFPTRYETVITGLAVIIVSYRSARKRQHFSITATNVIAVGGRCLSKSYVERPGKNPIFPPVYTIVYNTIKEVARPQLPAG
jgi:hypothetical protein